MPAKALNIIMGDSRSRSGLNFSLHSSHYPRDLPQHDHDTYDQPARTPPGAFDDFHHQTRPLPFMGSAINNATALFPRCCNLAAASAIPNNTLAFGLSKTDASFAALIWGLLVRGPP
jgi:hypothetical protein